jgi:hypothetical protein
MNWFALAALLLFPGLGHAQSATFDADPQHPWNRLRHHLYTRTAQDGTVYEVEGVDPAFVPRSKFLTEGASHQQALALLGQFLDGNADRLITDPLKRAVLQRDLWAVFVTTADPALPRQPQRRELQKRLAQVMRRVALTPEEISRLPDNLAAAVQSKDFPPAYDPAHAERPFLPADLVSADGPWVLLRSRLRRDDLAAPTHYEATSGRSTFLIFLRLPDGGRATEDYLKKLEAAGSGSIPQIPAGTQVALLRRMMLVDPAGSLRLAPLTESLQIRVYHKLETPDMFEFTLRRQDLFAGRYGGLRPTAADETNPFDLGFLGIVPRANHDPLEAREFRRHNDSLTPVVMKSCIVCHGGPGIYGFQSLFVDHFDSPPLAATDLKNQVSATIERTYPTYAWGLLEGLWEVRPAR